MTANLIIAFFATLTAFLFGVVIKVSFFGKKGATSELDRANSRIETLEGDMQTLRGQIGVLLGDKHPGGGLRSPSNSGRYQDRIAEMEYDQDSQFNKLVQLEKSKQEVKKKVRETRKPVPVGATQSRPSIFGDRRR